MDFLLAQLHAIADAVGHVPAPVARFNPRPAGVIREGSTSDAVLKFLRTIDGFQSEKQIMWMVQRSHSAVSWSLLYLARQGLVESRPDRVRNSRYKRYRATRMEKAK